MTTIAALFDSGNFVVYDTEYTTWPGAMERNWRGPGEHREIVQIGAVFLDAELQEIGVFSQLVRPIINPVLSDYFTELTGITNSALATEGRSLLDVLQDFSQFCAAARAACSFGPDDRIIDENCALAGIENPLARMPWLDIRSALLEIAKVDPAGIHSSNLPVVFGLSPQERAHDGLSDARAIASVLRYLRLPSP